ncbi:MAG: DUF4124 domain-containing protein [Nitrospirae bacterium]|nr:DUF4124 domain-containing protein [Candidatus Manganitrophaceae bacterium]
MNKIKKSIVSALVLLLSLTSFVTAVEIYRWLDETGTPHFTDDPAKVPPAFRKNATVEELKAMPSVKPIVPLESTDVSPPTDREGHNEEWWQAEIGKWRTKKEEAAHKLAEAEARLAQVQYGNEGISSRMAETGDLLKEIEMQKEAIRKAEEMIRTVLPEEARKADAPPGWLRE